jgi:hypothetical protein
MNNDCSKYIANSFNNEKINQCHTLFWLIKNNLIKEIGIFAEFFSFCQLFHFVD